MPGIVTQAINLISDGMRKQYGVQSSARSAGAVQSTGTTRSARTTGTDSTGKREETETIAQNEAMGKDAFFKLLITQLKYQDPLKPMENREFISQMAQFSSLEQMQNMNQMMSKFLKVQGLAEGVSLIGRTIKTAGSEHEQPITGKVSKVSFSDSETFVHLEDGQKVIMEDIEMVYQ